MRIEVLHYRDPDSECTVQVFIDGTEVPHGDIEYVDCDPGRGHDIEDWRESQRFAMEGASKAFAAEVKDAYDQGAQSEYVEGSYTPGQARHLARVMEHGTISWYHVGRRAYDSGATLRAPNLNAWVRDALEGRPVGDPESQRIMQEYGLGWDEAKRDATHPRHIDCADACGLAVTHEGPCLDKPGGRVVCTEDNHGDPDA